MTTKSGSWERPTDLGHPKSVFRKRKKQLSMKEIQVFHVRWLISDKRAESIEASGFRNYSQRCVSLLMYSFCFGALHITDSATAPSGTSGKPSRNTQWWQQECLPGCSVPIIPPAERQICLQTLPSLQVLQVGSGGLSSRLLLVQSSGPTACLFFLTLFLKQQKVVSSWKKWSDYLGKQ